MTKPTAFSRSCRGTSVTLVDLNLLQTGRFSQSRRQGFALVLVLCFVVLISVVVLAYLSRSILNRQISNSSANGTRADLFAQGAIDSILGDLKQEIVTGSSATTVSAGGVSTTFYTPLGAANAVPYGVGTNVNLPNLVKISTNSAVYPGGPIRATSDSTTNSSLNDRSVSLASWNQPLLLPKATPTSTTDYTPVSSFTAPTWILVARDGSNPTSFSPTTATNVIGRYAYAIYDEGGLLDANVAGYPSTATSTQTTHKEGLAYADLTQIPGMTTVVPGTTTTAADALVGWRNYASAQVSGTFPNVTFTSAAITNYFNAVEANNTGFLSTANTSLNNGASDQIFTSRQQLIDFFNNSLGAANNATLQNSLQYFGTFSRDLSQPSFTPNPNRPMIIANTTADLNGNLNGGNNSAGEDTVFNPPFLSIRATTAFTRNDGSTAVVGEPLVKKRFALNRLAWLTYEGPSALRTMTDVDMQALQNDGITQAFLLEGTATNIYNYFGLTWNSGTGVAGGGYWTYNHGITGSVSQPIIGYLSLVSAAAREPDFFELLKAGLTAGSLAKGATNPNGLLAESSTYTYDTNVDYAILQIGANIIAQSTTDGYSPRIQFNNGTILREFRGVKNLPYLYRIRSDQVMSEYPTAPGHAVPAGTATQGYDTGTFTPWTGSTSLSDTGSYAVFYQPEVWNPHDVNCSLGSPRPTNFRIVADGAPLDANGNNQDGIADNPLTLLTQSTLSASTGNTLPVGLTTTSTTTTAPIYSYSLDTSLTPPSYYTSNPNPTLTWTADTTALTFTDNGGELFREPTLLTEPNIPAGSNLALGPDNLVRTLYANPQLAPYTLNAGSSNMGVVCLNDVISGGATDTNPGVAVPYIGFLYGTGPLRWVYTISPAPASPNPASYVLTATADTAETSDLAAATASTYRVQYSSDNGTTWITYDEKYLSALNFHQYPFLSAVGWPNTSIFTAIGTAMSLTTVDPRSRRFGGPGTALRGGISAPTSDPAGMTATDDTSYSPPSSTTVWDARFSFWVDPTNNVLMSDRPDTGCGFSWCIGGTGSQDTICLPSVGGWYPNPSLNWNLGSTMSMYYQPGLQSQNNPLAISDSSTWQDEFASNVYSPQYYSDPDGVVRRAMGAYVPVGTSEPPASTTIGLPMATTGGSYAAANQSQSRPIILNRPFRSVAELGYVFSDTPWKNLSMFTPESGAAALLDVFCIQPDDNPSPVVAGKVDLNTRQEPVLQAILAGTYADELNGGNETPLSATEAADIANLLIGRTSNMTTAGQGPLANIAELVGKYQASVNDPLGGIDGSNSYTGFSGDLTTLYGSSGSLADPIKNNIERFREAAIRPLASVGTARVWNLLIDLVAQTGRYPSSATILSNFVVDGETRYWLHVAIDRQTGQVIDQHLEIVKE